ncbi:MAG: hypothetical protein LBQ63_04940 [Deltaproteobacteria bacterium]|jgi:hypothetical protein|nr:hypothetical protein [Deltaproteobacteria bacterium]
MSDTLACPRPKWIAVAVCSQGTEGGQCEYDRHRPPLPEAAGDWFGNGAEPAVARKYAPGGYAGELARGDALEMCEKDGPEKFPRTVMGIHVPHSYACDKIKSQYVNITIQHKEPGISKDSILSLQEMDGNMQNEPQIFSASEENSVLQDYNRLSEEAESMCYWPIIL